MGATTTTSSSSCSGFFSLRSSSSSNSGGGCGKIDGVAMWFINGVTMAFFASLNRCSCIRIATDEQEDGEDSNDLPLMLNDGNTLRHDHDGAATRRRTAGNNNKGKDTTH